jgi:signal transduction histidine kinase
VAERAHRLFRGPIRATTTAVAVFVVATALSVAAVLLVTLVRHRLESNAVAIVLSRADDIASLVSEGPLPPSLAFTGEDAALVQVVNSRGTVVSSTPNVTGRPPISKVVPSNDKPMRLTLRTLPVDRGQRFAVIAQRARGAGAGAAYVVYTAVSLDAADEGVRTLSLGLFGGIPVLVLLVGITTWILSGHVLEPVEHIREEVDEITAHRLHRRVPVSEVDDEISRLARTMNDMLDRLEFAAGRQQQFVADASHELRSPLAVMRTTLEVNLAHPASADWISTTKDLLIDHGRVERIVADLLVLARQGAADPRPFETLNLSGVVRAEISRRAGDAVPVEVDLEPGVMVLGDHDHIAQILRNLVDNAQRYARSAIVVRLRRDGGSAVLQVIDDGRGIEPENRERVFERFARLENEENRGHHGSGLGLAIVEELVHAHGGTVAVADVKPGTCFEVRLPAEVVTSA